MEGREQGMNREMDKDRVLLVEDDGSLIDGLEYALKKDGFEVEVARSGGVWKALHGRKV